MRKSGILLAVSSLPSRHGIGDFGPEAYSFVKSMKRMGFKLWQVLPLNPLGYGNSPYKPYSSKAMDELYTSLDMLVKDGLLPKRPAFMRARHASITIRFVIIRENCSIWRLKNLLRAAVIGRLPNKTNGCILMPFSSR
jgi:4-alpha-glucanotransferase